MNTAKTTGDIIKDLKDLLTGVIPIIDIEGTPGPKYFIEYESNDEMNVKTDSIPRDRGCILIRELERGAFTRRRRFGYWYKRLDLSIYFFQFGYFGTEAAQGNTPMSKAMPRGWRTRQEIRDEIETEVFTPFLSAITNNTAFLRHYQVYPDEMVEFPYIYPLPMYDGHDIGIELTLSLWLPIC